MRRLILRLRRLWLAERQRLSVSVAIALLLWGLWLAAFGPWLRQAQAAESGASSWLNDSTTLEHGLPLPSKALPPTVEGAGNIPCTPTEFTWRARNPGVLSAGQTTACAVATPSGLLASGGYVRVSGVDGKLFDKQGGPIIMYANPGQTSAVYFERVPGSLDAWRLHYYQDWAAALRPEYDAVKLEWKFYLDRPSDWVLQDKSGQELLAHPASTGFSSNGRWMTTDVPGVATVLVDVQTKDITPFSWPFVYDGGLLMPQTAASDDGRTVARASFPGNFIIADIATCDPVPDAITAPVNCNWSWADTFLRAKIPGYKRIYNPRFLNDRLLAFNVWYDTPASHLDSFKMGFSAELPSNQDYLALGDSFSSGEGAYDYFVETDTNENKCHLSRQSYPYLIGRRVGFRNYHSAACSGAKIQDITTFVQKQKLPEPNTMGNLLPGFQKQIQYVRDQNPSVVTVGIGGNDIGFISKMKACLNVGTCYQYYEDRLEMVREVNRQFATLASLYQLLKTETRSTARVYVVGYPRVAKEGGSCAVNVRLDSDEVVLVNQLIDYLNVVIATAARKTGLPYIDVSEAFAGHRLCETTAVQTAMNGITAGDDIWGIFGNESFHPNQLGHQLYTQRILTDTADLTRPMPQPVPSLPAPGEEPGLSILNAPRANRPVRQTINNEAITNDVLVKNQSFDVRILAQQLLRPTSRYSVQLHSEPRDLGSVTTDSNAEAQISLTIPPDVQPGFHTLHIFGKNQSNVDVDIYKAVYVAESYIDYDGDRIRNTIDECKDQPDSRVDADRDGIDDVCDMEVAPNSGTETPPAVPSSDVLVAQTDSMGNNPNTTKDILGASEQQNTPSRNHHIHLFAVVGLSLASLLTIALIVSIWRRRARKK